MFACERDMRPPVDEWLRSRVEHVIYEAWCVTPVADLLGFSFRAPAVAQRIALRQATVMKHDDIDPEHHRRPWMPLYSQVVAVEMKLTRMAEVVFQARTHYPHVTESWIAMPRPYARRVAERVDGTGIGVLEVTPGACADILAAKWRDPGGWKIARVAERFWRDYRPKRQSHVGAAAVSKNPRPA